VKLALSVDDMASVLTGIERYDWDLVAQLTQYTCVKAGDYSALPEVAKGAALLIDPYISDSLCEIICVGLSEEDWRLCARPSDLEVAKGYRWGKCVEQIARVYESVAC
jgi:glycosyltransferase involved in cell wall biosynthesis